MTKKQNSYKKIELVKVPTEELQLGMYVAELDRPWLETPFLLQGFCIEMQDDLDALRSLCEYVYIDMLKTHHLDSELQPVNLLVPDKPAIHYEATTTVEQEIHKASTAYQQNLSEIKSLLHTISEGLKPQSKQVKKHVKECVDSIERNPSAMMWLTRIKHADQYTAEHCVNVGVLAVSLGRHLGLSRQQLELLGLCGVLHDVGKMKLDHTILNKTEKLTREEYEYIKQHTTLGRDMLLEDELLPPDVVAAAYGHHERIDGHGYPDQLPEEQISFYSRVVSIVDAYDAITSRRCYSAPRSSAEALKILYENAGTQFDRKLVVKFIESIGIYPPGSVVELDSGEVGVVLSADTGSRLLPKVALLRDANKNPMLQKVIDLKLERATPDGVQHQIKVVLSDGAYGIDLEAFTRENINIGRALPN